MNTKILLTIAALVQFVFALVGTFMPDEVVGYLGGGSGSAMLFVQLLGAATLGLAMMNYMSRGSRIGGIYNKPLLIGNLAFWVSSAAALWRFEPVPDMQMLHYAIAGVFTVLALCFLIVFFRSPV